MIPGGNPNAPPKPCCPKGFKEWYPSPGHMLCLQDDMVVRPSYKYCFPKMPPNQAPGYGQPPTR